MFTFLPISCDDSVLYMTVFPWDETPIKMPDALLYGLCYQRKDAKSLL